jgi:hypothetical protein
MARQDGGLRREFRDRIPSLFWTTVETGGTEKGVPDSHYLGRGGLAGWLECKQTEGWTVTLEPEQCGWLDRYARYGGRCWIAVRRRAPGGKRSEPADSLYMVPGTYAIRAKRGGLRCPQVKPAVLEWHGGPGRWEWNAVRAALTGQFGEQ